MRVIVQGGGGAGAAGGYGGNALVAAEGGGGGSGGGFCDTIFNADGVTDEIVITAGSGGIGGTTIRGAGTSGGSSSFGNYIVSYGGAGGIHNGVSQTTTIGYNSGSAGGLTNLSPGLLPYLAGCGGGGGG